MPVSKVPSSAAQNSVELSTVVTSACNWGWILPGRWSTIIPYLYRIIVLGRQSNTQVVNTKEERLFVAPSLTRIPDVDTSFTLSMSYQRDPEGATAAFCRQLVGLWSSPAGQIARSFNDGDPEYDEFSRSQTAVGYQFEHRFNDTLDGAPQSAFTSILTTVTKASAPPGLTADGHTISRYALGTDESLRGLTSDLQLQAEFDSGLFSIPPWLDLTTGESSWRQIRDYGAAPSIDYLNPVYGVATNLRLRGSPIRNSTSPVAGYYLRDPNRSG